MTESASPEPPSPAHAPADDARSLDRAQRGETAPSRAHDASPKRRPLESIRRAARKLFGRDAPEDEDPNIYPLF